VGVWGPLLRHGHAVPTVSTEAEAHRVRGKCSHYPRALLFTAVDSVGHAQWVEGDLSAGVGTFHPT